MSLNTDLHTKTSTLKVREIRELTPTAYVMRFDRNKIAFRAVKSLKPGDPVNFENPVGYFIIRDADIATKKFLFIASGTGIAPFHSFVRSYPGLDYKLLHGVRYSHEAYEKHEYDKSRFVLCSSRDKHGDFNGRVTDYLRQNPVEDKSTLCFFCGNCEMIHEAYDIMLKQGIPSENLFAEVYF